MSIRFTPETIEKLNALAAKMEAETGQRISKNILIEQAAQAAESAPETETAGDTLEA